MKRNKIFMACAAVVAASMDQLFRPGFTPLQEQQQQARTGTVTNAGSTDPVAAIEAIAAADPLRATVGATIVSAMKATDDDVIAMGSFPAVSLSRVVVIVPPGSTNGADLIAALDATTNTVKAAELTFDDGNNNSPMTNAVGNGVGGVSTAINAAIAAQKPSFSVQSIINKLEDILAATAGAYTGAVVVDQEAEKVFLYTCPVANEATLLAVAHDPSPAGIDSSAVFEVNANPASSTEGQFGE